VVFYNDTTHLSHLVDFGVTIIPLQVNFLGHSWLSEDVVASAYTLLESQAPKQLTQFIEADICIRSASQDAQQELIILTHNDHLPHGKAVF
jgi:hypothetical protein